MFLPTGLAEHSVASSHVEDVFQATIMQPVRRDDGSERFPVLYMTDADSYFAAVATLAGCLQATGEVPRFILVGIGYGTGRPAGLLRMRDLHTRAVRELYRAEIEQVAAAPLGPGVRALETVFARTDAADFHRFIVDELMPFVDATYPTRPEDRSYFGFSAGGAFGLYSLFSEAPIFRRYILGSPVISHRGQVFGLRQVTDQPRPAELFVSVGELEDELPGLAHFDLCWSHAALVEVLAERPVPGLRVHSRILPGETHATAWAQAFVQGVKATFEPAADLPFAPDFMRR